MNGTVTAKRVVGTISGEGTLKGSVGALFGKEGDSAYEIAVHYGFQGTEEEWLESLHGRDGIDGYTPIKGVDYFDGAKGDQGNPGIYLGGGDMPKGYSVQLDPNGDTTTIKDIARIAVSLLPVYDGGFTDVEIYDGSVTKGAI